MKNTLDKLSIRRFSSCVYMEIGNFHIILNKPIDTTKISCFDCSIISENNQFCIFVEKGWQTLKLLGLK